MHLRRASMDAKITASESRCYHAVPEEIDGKDGGEGVGRWKVEEAGDNGLEVAG